MQLFRRTLVVVTALVVAIPQLATAQVRVRNAPPGYGRGGMPRLSGTYSLDQRRSDDTRAAVTRATQSMPANRRYRVYENWVSRLDSPGSISIDVRGNNVTLMSSSAPQVTFDADGRERTEVGPNGMSTTTRAYLQGNRLIVTTTGNRGSDFTATFEPVGDGLRVTRRLDSDYQQASVTVNSFYRRISDPNWNVWENRGGYGNDGMRRAMVPSGTQLTVRLEHELNARNLRDGERFTAVVVDNGQFNGARVEGVAGPGQTRTGQSHIVFDFDHIFMPNGRTGEFEARIESVQVPGGARIRVDQSGAVRDRNGSNSNQTIQNGAVGAAVGAIIGAIAGGGKGAAVGAIAGGGAGMLLLEGSGDLRLPVGTQIVITSFGAQ